MMVSSRRLGNPPCHTAVYCLPSAMRKVAPVPGTSQEQPDSLMDGAMQAGTLPTADAIPGAQFSPGPAVLKSFSGESGAGRSSSFRRARRPAGEQRAPDAVR